ncbi:MAG TPA: hypothetical protein ENH82_02070 [bacterium]|nr:hypothetical protein [bacterium]
MDLMFSYYGSKSKIIKYYSIPKYDTIIEPFAGSAQYSFKYWERQVILVEKFKLLYDVWNWLINEATPDYIMSLPLYNQSDAIYHDNIAVRDLLRLECCNGNTLCGRKVAGKYNRWSERNGRGRKRISENLHKIKHWKIIHGDYLDIPNIQATWFVDPPYNNHAGTGYVENCKNINYEQLGSWCKSRLGQTIVCEELLADWLPFEFLGSPNHHIGSAKAFSNIEAFWENENEKIPSNC